MVTEAQRKAQREFGMVSHIAGEVGFKNIPAVHKFRDSVQKDILILMLEENPPPHEIREYETRMLYLIDKLNRERLLEVIKD